MNKIADWSDESACPVTGEKTLLARWTLVSYDEIVDVIIWINI